MFSPLRLQIRLIKAPDDPALFSSHYQAELHHFKQQLEAAAITVSPTFTVFERGGTSTLTGQFLISWIASSTPILLNSASRIVMDWMNGRAGRTLKLKVGDLEVSAISKEDIDLLLKEASVLKASSPSPRPKP